MRAAHHAAVHAAQHAALHAANKSFAAELHILFFIVQPVSGWEKVCVQFHNLV